MVRYIDKQSLLWYNEGEKNKNAGRRKEKRMNRRDLALKQFAQGTVIPATPLVLDANRKFDPAGQKLLNGYYLEAGAGGIAGARL